MKKGILLIGGLLSLFTLASCNEETKIEYRDRIVEVEKPVEVIKEVEVTKEVPVETTVYVDREVVVEKEVEVPVEVEKTVYIDRPVEVEKIVEKEVTVEVPVEKIVEVEKPVEVIKTVYVEKEVVKEVEKPVLDLSLLTYNADITKVGNKFQYMVVDNQIYSLGNAYPEPALPNMTTAQRSNLRVSDLSSTYQLSCWPRAMGGYQKVRVNSAMVPSKYYGELSDYEPVDWKYVDYGNCYKRYVLVNAEVVEVNVSPDKKGGKNYAQCIVLYDYVLSL